MGKTIREPSPAPRDKNTLYIEMLKITLRAFNIPDEFYSIGEYTEEAVCLEKKELSWIVYEGERGKKYNIKTHMNCLDACHDIISRVAETEHTEKLLKDFFFNFDKKGFSLSGQANYKSSDLKPDLSPILGKDEFEPRASMAIH